MALRACTHMDLWGLNCMPEVLMGKIIGIDKKLITESKTCSNQKADWSCYSSAASVLEGCPEVSPKTSSLG